jgi:hypothetical protein
MYLMMAARTDVHFRRCATKSILHLWTIILFVIVGFTSVLATADNVENKMVGVGHLKKAVKAALKTGNIKVSHQEIEPTDPALLAKLTRYCQPNIGCDNWATFEQLERTYRLSLVIGRNFDSFCHPNPKKWWTVLAILTSIFYENGNLKETYNGKPWATSTLKYAKRALLKFPINTDILSEEVSELEVTSEQYKQLLMRDIPHMISFVKQTICPAFNTRQRGNPSPVSKQKLTQLWKNDKAKAIGIIKNDCIMEPSQLCPINLETVENHFKYKAKNRTQAEQIFHNEPWPRHLLPPAPVNLPSTAPFTEDELRKVLKGLPSRKAAGEDGLRYEDLRRNMNNNLTTLLSIFNTCFLNQTIPEDWKKSKIILIPQKGRDLEQIDNWRPISLTCIMYKVYMVLLKERLVPWLVNEERMCSKQKGAMPRPGLNEHAFCQKQALED